MSRLSTISDIVGVLQAQSSLLGTADATPGTWGERFGPKVTEWPDPQRLEDRPTCVFVENVRGTIDRPSLAGGAVIYQDEYTFDVVGLIEEHPADSSATRTLAGAMFEAVIAAFQSSAMNALAPSIELNGEVDGPSLYASDRGVWAEMRFSVQVTEFVSGA